MKTLSERIKESQEALVALKDQLVEKTKELEETPDDEEILICVDELSGQCENKTKQLDSLLRAEKALAERAKEETANAPSIITQRGDKEHTDLWLKEAVCSFLAHVERRTPQIVRADRYDKNKALETVMTTKTAVPLATTFDTGWANELMREDTRGFINLLQPTSVAAALSARGLVLDFGGFDSIKIPRRATRLTTGKNMGGAFVGEGGAIPLGQMSISSQSLARYKMGVISTFSKELAQRSTPAIESIIRQAILDDMAIELDGAFLDANAAMTGIRPAGITNGVTPITGTVGGGTDAVIADIKAALNAMTTAGLGSNPVMLLNSSDAMSVGFMQTALGEFIFRDSMASGSVLGVSVIKSLNIPAGTMILVDVSQLAMGLDAIQFDVSDVASVVEANADDTAPTHAADDAGTIIDPGTVGRNGGIPASGGSGAAVAGATTRSLFQTWSIGVRAVKPISWGFMQPAAVVVVDTLSW